MLDSILLIIFLFIWGLIHSIMASLQIKSFIKNRFGEMAIRYYRLVYNIFAVVSFLPILGLMVVAQDIKLYSIPRPWVFIFLIIRLLSLIILAIGLKQTGALEFLGLNIFKSDKASSPTLLIKNGLYKYVRHPLYSAGLVFLWCSPVMTSELLIVSLCLTIYIFVGAKFEERKLENEFGDHYRDYKGEVPMLIPRVKLEQINNR